LRPAPFDYLPTCFDITASPTNEETTVQYLLLIYENEQGFLNVPQDKVDAMMGDYRSLIDDIAKKGHYKGGHQLQPTPSATTVRVRSGKRTTTDGPFAETREQLGGYFLVDAPDLDAAIGIAERIPSARTGSIEIRPVVARATA
jgi:hypothetical protein